MMIPFFSINEGEMGLVEFGDLLELMKRCKLGGDDWIGLGKGWNLLLFMLISGVC